MEKNEHNFRHYQGNRAFTLIECLVAVSIIGILAAFVVGPGIKILKTNAASAGCMSNLRQLGIAFHTFAAENNGEFPVVAGPGKNGNDLGEDQQKGKGKQWDAQLLPYLNVRSPMPKTPNKKTVFFCPASAVQPTSLNRAVIPLSYTYNVNVGKSEANPTTMPGIRYGSGQNSSSIVLLADLELLNSTVDASYVPETGQGNNNVTVFRPGAGYYPYLSTRHNKSMNILFLDGHAEPRRRLDEYSKTSPPENVRWTPTGELTGSR